MAFSISCLIVASIAMLLMVPSSTVENGHDRLKVNFSLLPGVAVAATIILLQLFVITAAATPDRSDEVPARKSAQNPAKPKPPGRPKKEKLAEKESKEVANPVGSTS